MARFVPMGKSATIAIRADMVGSDTGGMFWFPFWPKRVDWSHNLDSFFGSFGTSYRMAPDLSPCRLGAFACFILPGADHFNMLPDPVFIAVLVSQALILLFKHRDDLRQRPYFRWRETQT